MVCEIGERMTKEFHAFYEALLESNWYTYPMEMRQIFALVLANAQKPVIVQGFGSTFCMREYFRLVILNLFKLNFNYKAFLHNFICFLFFFN